MRCEWCGGNPGNQTSCVNCGAPVPASGAGSDAPQWLAAMYENVTPPAIDPSPSAVNYLRQIVYDNPALTYQDYLRRYR